MGDEDKPYDVIILSGGGSKAISELGVVHYHHERGLIGKSAKEYRGASAGSIIALLLVCGYAPMEIFQHIYVLKNLLGELGSRDGTTSIYKNKGLIPIKQAFGVVKELVKKKFDGNTPTLLELRRLTGKRLIISVFNMTKNRQEYFTSDTKPNISCLKAVMASSNLPGIFQEFIYEGDTYLDGGLGDNFPAVGIDPACRVLGVIVTGKDSLGGTGDPLGMFSYISRAMMFPVNTMTNLRGEIFKNMYPNSTLVNLEIDDVPVVEFSMSSERKMDIFMKGYAAAVLESKKRYLNVKGWKRVNFDLDNDPTEEEFRSWEVC
jgi:predicted acylesterase/phospholipase RssA